MPAEYLREEEDFEEDTLFDQAGLLTNKIKQRSDVRNASAGMRITPMKTFALCLAFFGLGLSMAILEPTLLDLQYLAGTDVQHISYTLTARSTGFILGSILGFLLFERYNRQFLLFLVMLAMAVLLGVLPWCHNLIAYIVILILLGALMQMLQAGGNVLCLDLWGRQSGPFLQAIHFSMALGLFIAPFLSNAILAGKAGAPVGDGNHVHNVNSLHALALPASTLFGVQITANGKHNRHLRSVPENETNSTDFTISNEFSNNTLASSTIPNISANMNETLTAPSATVSFTTQQVIEIINSTNTPTPSNISLTSPNPATNFSDTTTTASKITQNDTDSNSTKSTVKPHKPKPGIIDAGQLKKDASPWARKKQDTDKAEAPNVPPTTPTPHLTSSAVTANDTVLVSSNNSSNATDKQNVANLTSTQAVFTNNTNQNSSVEPLATTSAINQSDIQSTLPTSASPGNDTNVTAAVATTTTTTTTTSAPNTTTTTTVTSFNVTPITNSTLDLVTNESTTLLEVIRSTTDISSTTALNDTSPSNTTTIANDATKPPISLPVLDFSTKSSVIAETTTATTTTTTETESTIAATTQVTTTTADYSPNSPLSENSTITTTKTTSFNLTLNNSNITNNSYVLHDNEFTVDDNLTDGSSIEDSTNSTAHRKPYTFNNQTDYNQLLLADFFNKISELGVTKVHIVYVAMAVIVLLTSVVFLSFLCHNPRELRSKQEGSITEGANERKFVSVLTAILFIFMMFYTGAELIFSQLYLSLVLQSGAHLLRSRGSLLISVFWGVYTFSRGTSICCTNGFKPATMLILDLSCCIVSATTLVIYGPQVESILWCSVAIMAIGLSSILPYSLLWLEDYIHISNKTACAILLGNAIVHLVLSFVYGHPISLASSVVIYLVLACCVFALLLFGVAWRLATWRGDKYKTSKANVRYQLANQVEDDDDNVEMAAGSSSLYLLNNETSHSNSDNLYFSLKQKKNVWK